jgi:hypothetical protein
MHKYGPSDGYSDPPYTLKVDVLRLNGSFMRCWSVEADSGPSFREILAELEQLRFALLPGSDSDAVEQGPQAK